MKSRLLGMMEAGKTCSSSSVIKEESNLSPTSPAATSTSTPTGKENRQQVQQLNNNNLPSNSSNCGARSGTCSSSGSSSGSGGSVSPLQLTNNSEILTRSRSKGLQPKEPHPHQRHRSESPSQTNNGNKSPSPTNLTIPRPSSHQHHYPVNGRTPSPIPQMVSAGVGSSGGSRVSSSSISGGGGSSSGSGSSGGNSRLLLKIKRFLGTLVQFGCDISPDVGERVRALVFSLVSGHLSIEEFHHSLQEVTSFPLRPFVLPFLRAHLPLLQREIGASARVAKQSILAYVQSHEGLIVDVSGAGGEPCDIFHSSSSSDTASDLTIGHKRKAANNNSDHGSENGDSEGGGGGGYVPTPKRHHHSIFSPAFLPPDFREYYQAAAMVAGYAGIPLSITASSGSQNSGNNNHHLGGGVHVGESSNSAAQGQNVAFPLANGIPSNKGGGNGSGTGEEEWKNIHTMLNCILSMVEKTKRALSILQTRTHASEQDSSVWLRRPGGSSALLDGSTEEFLKRQLGEMMAQAFRSTEERVAEVKRRAEEAVQDVKRQALIELKRAVAAAEARACEAVSSDRVRLDRVLTESHPRSGSSNLHHHPTIVNSHLHPPPGVEAENCWNCGRKAHETCSGCNTARYCSSFCQHKDWETHHTVCKSSSTSSSSPPTGATIRSTVSEDGSPRQPTN